MLLGSLSSYYGHMLLFIYISRRVQAGRTEQKSGNCAAFRLPIRNNDTHGRPGMVRSGHSPAGLVPTVLLVHKPHVFVQLLFIEGPKSGSLQYADIAAHGLPATPEGASRHGTAVSFEQTPQVAGQRFLISSLKGAPRQ